MSLLWRLVFTSRCTSTHHKLALDALRFLRGPMADVWSNLFLANHEQYLSGSKAPDDVFKDFKNHVLHVNHGFWGGATLSARTWYQKTVTSLNQGNWPDAVYNAGVLSHYFTDPFQPFHTDQTEAEGKVHRAAEWSITKSYDELQAILEHELGGYPQYELPERPDWLEEAIRQGATEAHRSYDVCIDHYDLSRGVKNPAAGLDQEMKDRLAQLIGMASVGFSRVLERAFEEAAVTPPDVAVSLHAFLATLKMPLNWIMRKLTDAHERSVVEAIYLEVQEKGKAIDSLPEDEKTVRKQYAQEVLRVPMRQLDAEPARLTGTQYGTGKPARGSTGKASTAATFERTTVSAPGRLDHTGLRDGLAGLESCLMVPLAANSTIDHVADTALRAILSQALNQRVPSPNSTESRIAAKVLNPTAVNPIASAATVSAASPAESVLNKDPRHTAGNPVSTTQGSTSVRLSRSNSPEGRSNAPEERSSSVARPGADQRRQRRRERAKAAGFPELTPPALNLAPVSLDYAPSVSGATEVMFAPLPPMPLVKSAENFSPDHVPVNSVPANPVPLKASGNAGLKADSKPAEISPFESARKEGQVGNSSDKLARSAPVSAGTSSPGKAVEKQKPETPSEQSWNRTSDATRLDATRSGATIPQKVSPSSAPSPASRGAENKSPKIDPATQKSFVAEPPTSPIPVPHIRVEGVSNERDSLRTHEEYSGGRQSTTPQVEPRIAISRPGSQPVNRISNIVPVSNIVPARARQTPAVRSETESLSASVSDRNVSAGSGTVGKSPSSDQTVLARNSMPTVGSAPNALQSSLFRTVKTAPLSPAARVNPAPNPSAPPVAKKPDPIPSGPSQPTSQPTSKGPLGGGTASGRGPTTVPATAPPKPFPPLQPLAASPTVPAKTPERPADLMPPLPTKSAELQAVPERKQVTAESNLNPTTSKPAAAVSPMPAPPAVKPEAVKRDAVKPEPAKTSAPMAATSKPEAPKPESPKSQGEGRSKSTTATPEVPQRPEPQSSGAAPEVRTSNDQIAEEKSAGGKEPSEKGLGEPASSMTLATVPPMSKTSTSEKQTLATPANVTPASVTPAIVTPATVTPATVTPAIVTSDVTAPNVAEAAVSVPDSVHVNIPHEAALKQPPQSVQEGKGKQLRPNDQESVPVALTESSPAEIPVESEETSSSGDMTDEETADATRGTRGASRSPRERRYFLELTSNLEEAPSIGPKTAQVFAAIGVKTVFDLLRINTDQAAAKLGNPRITPGVLKDLQAQALLVCRVAELRGHDAQYLVACGIRTAEQLANSDPQTLLLQVQTFLATSFGQRMQRGCKTPDLDEVTEWIACAREARSLRND